MSGQSPQRARKSQGYPGPAGQPPREMSPSPTIRDRQRTLKAQSMSHVPGNQRQGQQPSPTTSISSQQSKRQSPPPGTVVPSKLSSSPLGANLRELSPERLTPPPAPTHALTQSNIHQAVHPPLLPPHSSTLPNIHSLSGQSLQMGYPRPINRMQAPFLDEKWEFTPELLADIERADLQQSQGAMAPHAAAAAAGKAGVAYAGGAASAAISYSRIDSASPPKDPGVERVRATERGSPKDGDSGHGSNGSMARRRDTQTARESPQNRDRSQSTSHSASSPAYGSSPTNQDVRDSPQFHTPLGSPGEQSASYMQYKHDSYQQPLPPQRIPTPPLLRRGSNASTTEPIRDPPLSANKYASQTPPLQTVKTRTPDRSLPVQEEAEDDPSHGKDVVREIDADRWHARVHQRAHDRGANGSPTPSSDLHPEGHETRYDSSRGHTGRDSRAGHREEDDEETLFEQESDDQRQSARDRDDEDGGHTPRSPTADLPDEGHRRSLQNPLPRPPVQVKHRNGTLDQLGLKTFDMTSFDTFETKQQRNGIKNNQRQSDDTDQSRHLYVPPPQSQYQRTQREEEPRAINGHPQREAQQQQYHPPQMPSFEDFNAFLDDPAAAYIHAYLNSPRPNAPIPPTPHSQTAAPSPSPLLSAMHTGISSKDLPLPVGSPYPFPFNHVRRSHSYSNSRNGAPSSNYDPNHPTAIQEQLALQMQMYAINNQAMLSDSTLSPSSTPFPPGYNPWAFMQARLFGNRQVDQTMSLQSSPSHEPIPLPPPPHLRGRGLKKRERSTNLRQQGSARQHTVPPRVESTQPRETSPELSSSGEETAGEEKYEAVHEEENWTNGHHDVVEDNGEWIDEDEEGDETDLIELEYHTSYVSNVEKRRRRWETRWEALVEAFQALDRQTDATMVLLAAPSHSTKLHAVLSRSIRRDSNITRSAALSNMRSAFNQIAARRRATRSRKQTLAERVLASGSSEGSDGSSESREEDLRRALEAALGSLGAVSELYEQREARWKEEMRKVAEDREKVQLLLRQVLPSGSTSLNIEAVGRAL